MRKGFGFFTTKDAMDAKEGESRDGGTKAWLIDGGSVSRGCITPRSIVYRVTYEDGGQAIIRSAIP